MLTHVIAQTAINVRVTLLGGLEVLADAKSFDGVGIAAVQRDGILDVNAVIFVIFLDRLHIVANLPLQADIGHETVAGFRVDAGHVACVGVTVWVAVFNIEQDHKIIAVFDRLRHVSSSL